MTETLLQTKLHIPHSNSDLVSRSSLFKKLNAGLRGKLTLISAPAGFGKTTLVVEWINQLAYKVGWFSLDEDDNDSQQFFSYLAAATRPFSSTPLTLFNLLQSPQPLPPKTLVKAFINDIATIIEPYLLILDDFHFIQSSEICEAISFLLDHIPSNMHLVLTSRADPMLPLPRLRARRQLTEIRAADLRMTEAETAVFLNNIMQLNLAPEDIAALEARTEGWIAGLQLAAISLEKLTDSDKHQFISDLSGDDRYILDYLLDEVLRYQSEDIQTFLLKTAVLDRFNAELCEAVAGNKEQRKRKDKSQHATRNAQQILEYLDRTNLFLIPLDNKRGWYRYHHLFADLLTNQLMAANKALISELHQRASQWFEQQEMLQDAFAHAWKSQNMNFVLALVNRHARDFLVRADLMTLVSWLSKLPQTHLSTQPQLCIYLAWAATTLLQLETAVSTLTLLENMLQTSQLPDEELSDWTGQIAIIRGLIASKSLNIPSMTAFSNEGIAQLHPDNHLLHGLAVSNLATAAWFGGDTIAAYAAIEAAIGINKEAGNISETLLLYGMLAQSTFEMGDLYRAETICWEALALTEQDTERRGKRPFPATGFIYVQLGQLYHEWNRLEEAGAYVQKGIQVSQDESIGNLMMLHVMKAMLHDSQGEKALALDELAKVRKLTAQMTLVQIMEQAADIEAYIHLQRREFTAVSDWASTYNIQPTDTPIHFHEPRYLIFAQYLVLQHRWAEAETLLVTLRHLTQLGGRTGRTILALVITALAHHAQGEGRRAAEVLQEAITLAQPHGYIRIFRNADPALAAILHTILPENSEQQAYIQTLLNTFQDVGELRKNNRQSSIVNYQLPIVETLSERELEVLRLVANGHSNRQIADELFLALGTVKKHISNIFGKLQVSSRTQAVAQARELDLI